MPWSVGDYPSSMKNLDPKVLRKAIDIANAVLEETGDEGRAVSVGIAKAKEFFEKKGSSKPLLEDEDETQQTISAPATGGHSFAGALTASDIPTDPSLLVRGVGVFRKSQAESGIRERVADMAAAASKGDWGTVHYYASNGIIQAMSKALVDHEMTGNWYDPDTARFRSPGDH